MVYPKISQTFMNRFTSLLFAVNIICGTLTWTQGAAAQLASRLSTSTATPTLPSTNNNIKINEEGETLLQGTSNSHHGNIITKPLSSSSSSPSSLPSSPLSSELRLSSASSSSSNRLEKRSIPFTDEALTRSWNLANPSASAFIGVSDSSSPSLASPLSLSPSSSSYLSSSSFSIPRTSSSQPASLNSLTNEYETGDLDSSSSDSFISSVGGETVGEYGKRDPGSRYAFGLGKRAPESRYSFGIGKRLPEISSSSRYLAGSKRLPSLPFQFGLGKKSRYSFGLGKRDLYEYMKRRYNFGIGKRAAAAQRYAFGLGK